MREELPGAYWGDRLFVTLAIGCGLLIVLVQLYDLIRGVFGF
jgi:hypothetical protein